ncbi:MAG: DUF481 domain-containing protein [Spirochaetota bacterium]|nr:DUF481 domain-containing protein [Spirochaetota bacterium]
MLFRISSLIKLFVRRRFTILRVFITLFTLVFIIFTNSLYSQIVNIQPFLKEKSLDGFSFKLKGAFEWKTGNTDMKKLDLALAGRYIKSNHLILAITEASYAKKNAERFISKTFNHLRYRYKIINWLGFEGFGQYEFDEFRRIDLRALGGLGFRLTPISTKIIEISLASAYMYEINRNKAGNFPDSSLESTYHRWSSYLNIDITLASNLNLFSTLYIQPRFDEFSDYRLLNENSLTIKVNKWLNFVLQSNISYDSTPLYGVKALNTSVTTAIELTFDTSK